MGSSIVGRDWLPRFGRNTSHRQRISTSVARIQTVTMAIHGGVWSLVKKEFPKLVVRKLHLMLAYIFVCGLFDHPSACATSTPAGGDTDRDTLWTYTPCTLPRKSRSIVPSMQ